MSEVVALMIRKCSCGSVWCQDCFRRFRLPELRKGLGSWGWEHVRHVVFTLDRKKFSGPGDGLEWGRRHLAYVVHDLKRTGHSGIEGYYSFLEWHRDGFPHWHVLFKVAGSGRSGMIGGALIRKYWDRGAVHESYFKSEKDFEGVVGYFQKMGYFEKSKRHQTALPAWVLAAKIRVKRVSKSLGEKGSGEKRGHSVVIVFREKERKDFEGYGEKIKSCGSFSEVSIYYKGLIFGGIVIALPYRLARKMQGKYVAGVGYVVNVSRKFFLTWGAGWATLRESLGYLTVSGCVLEFG